MRRRHKLYLIAFVAYIVISFGLVGVQTLVLHFGGPTAFATIFSSSFLGGFIMVFGILRDDSAIKDKERADEATAENQKLRKQNAEARQLIQQARQEAEMERMQATLAREQTALAREQAEWEREQTALAREQAERAREQAEQARTRAEQVEAELQRVRVEHDREIAARFRRLEAATGITPPEPDADPDAS